MKNKTLVLGFAETDITPSASIETVGFGREDEMSRGILHPLSAQVIIWQPFSPVRQSGSSNSASRVKKIRISLTRTITITPMIGMRNPGRRTNRKSLTERQDGSESSDGETEREDE